MRYTKKTFPKRERPGGGGVRAVWAVSLLLAAACFVCILSSASTDEHHGDDLMSMDSTILRLGEPLTRVEEAKSDPYFNGVDKGQSSPLTRVDAAKSDPYFNGVDKGQQPLPSVKEATSDDPYYKSFVVAGIDLNRYHYAETNTSSRQVTNEPPFELFQDFDISSQIKGDERWERLVYKIRRDLLAPAMSFYVDKVAMKRWLPSLGVKIPKAFVLQYKSELTSSGSQKEEKQVIRKLLPPDGTDYCAKPTHTSYSDGVWLVKNEISDKDTIHQYLSTSGHGFKDKTRDNVREVVSASLAKSIHEPARSYESVGLKNVKPGIVVEERYTSFDRDDRPAVEFKVFCIWGRVFVSTYKQGSQTFGVFWRDGSPVKTIRKKHPWEHDKRPSWVDWNGVVELAEKLAANKDMIRVDIYLGRPAQQTELSREEASIVLSELEIHPTSVLRDPTILEEAARLWIAGYKLGNYRLIPNNQVPKKFLETGMLSEEDAKLLSTKA